MPAIVTYGSHYDPGANWGYWMTPIVITSETGQPAVMWEDEDGTVWPSVRTAFWCKRLNMRGTVLADELMDLMCDALSGVGKLGSFTPPKAMQNYEISFWREYVVWLNSAGLINHGTHPLAGLNLTEEGNAVHIMLKATRVRPRVARWTPREIFMTALRDEHLAQARR